MSLSRARHEPLLTQLGSVHAGVTVISAPSERFSRNPPRCSCHTIVSTCSTVYRDPKAAQGTSKTDYGGGGGGGGGRWVAAQKPPYQHLAGETSLLGATRSPTAVARAPVTSRDGHNRPRPSLDHTGVTVVAAPKG